MFSQQQKSQSFLSITFKSSKKNNGNFFELFHIITLVTFVVTEKCDSHFVNLQKYFFETSYLHRRNYRNWENQIGHRFGKSSWYGNYFLRFPSVLS